MCSLEQQYHTFLSSNPWAKGMTFEQWEQKILNPKLKRAAEQIKELNKKENEST